uniref:Putative membrane protein n=1 Tax=Jahnella sp. MSr9139 TaxID=1434086 RepID=A0A3S7UW39_9BACT|nr:putative membrane protein [Jahnella sp. MSr9139]
MLVNRTPVFTLRAARDGQSAEQRAAAASAALRRAVEDDPAEVRTEAQGDVAVVLVGARPIVTLGPEDAAAAGDPTPEVHASRVAAQLRDALRKEQSRSATLMTLLSVALVVLSGILGLFLIQRAGVLADKTRAWIADNPERVPAIRLRSIEVIRPASLRAAIHIGVGAAKALAQVGVLYGWVLIALSLFEPTRVYAEQLTGFVFGPLYALLVRLVSSLPLLVVALIASIALIVLVRFVGLFFDSVARGETTVEWLPADLAVPTSLLVRAAIILAFFVLAAPLVTGDDGGTLARVGIIAVVALGLAITPLLASVAVGVTVVYGRRLRVHDFAEIGGREGRVCAITLLEVRLEDARGHEVRVPHLLGLIHPTRVLGPEPLVTVVLTLAPATAGQEDVRDLLLDAAGAVGQRPAADLLAFDADGALYSVSAYSSAPDARARLNAALAAALTAAGVPLGRPPRSAAAAEAWIAAGAPPGRPPRAQAS